MRSTITGHGVRLARVVSSLVTISFVLFVVRYLPPVWFCGLVVLGIGIGMHEFYRPRPGPKAPGFSRSGIGFGVVLALSFVVNHQAAGGAQSALNANAVGLVLTLAVLWVTGLDRCPARLRTSPRPSLEFC